MFDKLRCRQIVTNLLTNALKFSEPGQEIVIEDTKIKNFCIISVKDQGPGIPLAFQSRVFDKFATKQKSSNKKLISSGLGLHISKLLVERHGGEIWFETEEGKGSTFSFSLPLTKV